MLEPSFLHISSSDFDHLDCAARTMNVVTPLRDNITLYVQIQGLSIDYYKLKNHIRYSCRQVCDSNLDLANNGSGAANLPTQRRTARAGNDFFTKSVRPPLAHQTF
jgi:hypothetical protein